MVTVAVSLPPVLVAVTV
jgi:hypothetical protein